MRLRTQSAALLLSASALMTASLAGCAAGSHAQGGDARSETGGVQRPPGETQKAEAPKAEAPKAEAPSAKKFSPPPDGSTQTASGASTPTAEARVVIEDFAFSPAGLTVAAGTKVTWVNRDTDPHTATSTGKSFNSGALDTGEEFSFVFKEKGVYEYYCALHPHMKGRVTVK